ncbi:hypothetical protein ACF1AE_20835 [Streptomyces sp. NPDC014986]|uniref:hypothetical protein n=1 Tax=Streptomyces sp. NPDC014986 TaxID=3364934 RepID=UPI0036F749CB
MQILVPDDPVFMSRFTAIEQPLLHHLYYFYLSDLDNTDAKLIRAAYDSWDRIQRCLPVPLRWPETTAGAGAGQHTTAGHVLHAPDGSELPSLYAVQLPLGHLCALRACCDMLREARTRTDGPLAEALEDLAVQGPDLVDGFRRAVEVMELSAPRRLLEVLRRASPAGPVTALALDEAQRADYRDFCGRVVYVLSAGDEFGYTCHRALYG